MKVHPLSDVLSKNIGQDTNIWQFCVVLPNAIIGSNCNICANVLIENDVIIGNNVTIKCYVEVCDGVTLEDNVFIGPHVAFTNDISPRSKIHPEKYIKILVKKGASIGASTIIVPGITIGEYAMIGAGSLITKNIPPNTLWYGNPAKQKGFVTNDGILLDMEKKDKCGKYHEI